MGKVHSIEQLAVSTPSYPGEWIPEGRTNYCQLLKNRDTGYVAEEYIVPADERIPLMRTFEIYDHRRQQTDYLVQVIQAEREPPSYICQGGEFLRVKTERIPSRLSEIKYLDQDRGLLVLEQALIGYKSIFNFQGPVLINDDMIGFNQNGKVKVWLNNNFAKNTPDGDLQPPRYEENTYHAPGITNEAGMVSQVVDVVQEHIDPQQFKDFMDLFYATSPKSFAEALKLVKEYSAARNVGMHRESYKSNAPIPSIKTIGIEQPTISHVAVPQHYVPAQSQTFVIQNSSAPSITKSIQAPTQPYIIENFAPEQGRISYEQQYPVTYYVQQPISQFQIIEEPYVATAHVESVLPQPQSIVYEPRNIVQPRSSIIQKQEPQVYQHPQVVQRQTIQNIQQYQPQPVTFAQQPIHQIPQAPQVQKVQHIHHPLVQPVNNIRVTEQVHPASQIRQVVSPNSQIVTQNSQVVVSLGSQIVTPASQVVTPNSQIHLGRANHRLSFPSPRAVQTQHRVSPIPARVNKIEKSLSPFVSRQQITNQRRGPSPTIFRPKASPAIKRPYVVHFERKTQGVSSGRSVTAGAETTATGKNQSSDIVNTQSQLSQQNRKSQKREEYRKSQVKEPHPTHNIGRALHGIKKTISLNDPTIDLISPTLVTAQNAFKKEETKVEVVRANPPPPNNLIKQRVQHRQQIIPFNGLPHKRSTLQNVIVASQPTHVTTVTQVQPQVQLISEPKSVPQPEKPKTTIANQQALLDKLESDISKTLIDFSNPFNKPTTTQQEMFSTFGNAQMQQTSRISHPTPPTVLPVRPTRPTQPKPQTQAPVQVQVPVQPPQPQPRVIQPAPVFASFNYKPFKPQVVQQRSIFQLGDNVISNISGIRADQITGASGVSTFTNPLENRAQVNEVVFTEVKSLATYDSVNPQVRKLMMHPRNQQPQNFQQHFQVPHPYPHPQQIIQEVRGTQAQIIQNIPMAESHQIDRVQVTTTITNTQIAANNQHPVIVEEITEVIESTYEHVQQDVIRTDVLVTNNDLWISNDSVNAHGQNIVQGPRPTESIGETLVVNQTIRENPTVVSEVRVQKGLDIESLMRKHNEESKNLFERYQEYGKNIQRQLSPNTPTSPSSLPKQTEIRYGEEINNINLNVVRQTQAEAGYQIVETAEFYDTTGGNQAYQRVEENEVQIDQVHHHHTQEQKYEIHNVNQHHHRHQQPVIIHHQQIVDQYTNGLASGYAVVTEEQITDYQPVRYQVQENQYEVVHTYGQPPSSRDSRGYEYVTNEQAHQGPSYGRVEQEYYRREERPFGDTFNFKQTTQSYNYEEVDNNIQHIRGTAPTYEELRAALLETNVGLQRETERYQQYTTEYRYETTAYDDRT